MINSTTTGLLFTTDADGAIRVQLVGSITEPHIAQLRGLVRDHILGPFDVLRERRRAFVVLDFAGAGYVDTRALVALKGVAYLVQSARGSFVFEHVNDELRALLKATKLLNVFSIRNDDAAHSRGNGARRADRPRDGASPHPGNFHPAERTGHNCDDATGDA